MTFHFLITGLVVLAVLLFTWAAAIRFELRRSRRRAQDLDFRDWRDEWEWEQ